LEKEGLKPWLDKKSLRPGDEWEKRIPTAIRASGFFLVLLTRRSVNKKGYLQKEIKEALDMQDQQPDNNRYLVPVRLELCQIPERLGHIQSADLFEPDGWAKLLEILSDTSGRVDSSDQTARPEKKQRTSVGGVPTPCFFPSISSAAKNSLSPADHLKVLVQLNHPLFLISAFDLVRGDTASQRQISILLKKAIGQGQIVLMDSGLYEKKWRHAEDWPREAFHRALRSSAFHLAFCYDNINPPSGVNKVVSDIAQSVRLSQRESRFQSLIPIVHSKNPKDLPAICVKVANALDPSLIALAERELGDSVRSCARTISRIRTLLNRETNAYLPIHILGTGNPLSILLYSWAGADSFDGLDWCQTVVDHREGRLYHSLQLDFFLEQSAYASDPDISYMTRVLGHNLAFYKAWMRKIQEHIQSETLNSLLDEFLPVSFLSRMRTDLEGVS
jgi:queuine/archaeosine tRNA-ribosyltransferase